MTHLGQRLSALIDGELEASEREHVLLHMERCHACREEVAALSSLKRRMSALGEAAAGAGLTGRLIRLSALASMAEHESAEEPPPPPSSPWPQGPAGPPGRGQADGEQRTGRYFLAGSLAVFLAGLGTAAFIAGGEPQPQAPTPPVMPSVDVMVFPHGPTNIGTGPPVVRAPIARPRPALPVAHPSHTGT